MLELRRYKLLYEVRIVVKRLHVLLNGPVAEGVLLLQTHNCNVKALKNSF